jgi:hypothetical protein
VYDLKQLEFLRSEKFPNSRIERGTQKWAEINRHGMTVTENQLDPMISKIFGAGDIYSFSGI